MSRVDWSVVAFGLVLAAGLISIGYFQRRPQDSDGEEGGE